MLSADDIKDEFLICYTCRNEFNEDDNIPRVLPCLHTFCEICLQRMASKSIIKCPICNTKCSLSTAGIQGFPIDVTRRNLHEFLKVKQRSSDILCRDCPDDSTASDFCRDCYIFMCEECTSAHRRSLASRNHVVLSISDLQRSGPEIFQRKMKCSKAGHEGQPLEFYCSNAGCKMLVCATCTVCDHDESKGHIIQRVADYHSRKTSKLQESLEVMDENIKGSKSAAQQYKQDLVNMDIKEYEAEKDIDVSFSICQKVLENRKTELKEELSSAFKSRKSDLQIQITALERFVEDMSNARDFLQSILKHTDPTEFVTLHATFCKRLKSLARQNIDANLNFNIPEFEPVEMGELFCNHAVNMGRVNFHNSVSPHTEHIVPLERSLTDTYPFQLKRPKALKPINMKRGQTMSEMTNTDSKRIELAKLEKHPEVDLNLQLMSTSPISEGHDDYQIGQQASMGADTSRSVGSDHTIKTTKSNRSVLSKSVDFKKPVLLKGRTDVEVFLPSLSKSTVKKTPFLSKSHTELGSSVSTNRKTEKSERRFRNIVCPEFTFDEKTVHQYRRIEKGLILKNIADPDMLHINGENNLKNFRGVIGSRSFKHPGKFYFEVIINYVIRKTLDTSNMVFEIGLCRFGEIDSGFCIYNHEHGWSFSVQQCQEHQSLCQWFRHGGKTLAHVQLSSAKSESKAMLQYGFLLDTDHKKWTIVDCGSQKCLYKFQGVEFTRQLWPVFGCHWPSKVTVEMTLITGHNISVIPHSIYT